MALWVFNEDSQPFCYMDEEVFPVLRSTKHEIIIIKSI